MRSWRGTEWGRSWGAAGLEQCTHSMSLARFILNNSVELSWKFIADLLFAEPTVASMPLGINTPLPTCTLAQGPFDETSFCPAQHSTRHTAANSPQKFLALLMMKLALLHRLLLLRSHVVPA